MKKFIERLLGNKEIEVFDVIECPLNVKMIWMKKEDLERFCRKMKLPMFKIEVRETVHQGIGFPVNKPYGKIFTIWNDLWLCCAIQIPDKEKRESEKINELSPREGV